MNKTIFAIITVVVLGLIGFGIYSATKSGDSASNTESKKTESADKIVEGATAILFYGKGCPHCENVDKWIAENKVAEKVKFDRREVWYNKANASLLAEKAKSSGIEDDSVGVPFLYDIANNKSYVGENEVIDYFKEKIK